MRTWGSKNLKQNKTKRPQPKPHKKRNYNFSVNLGKFPPDPNLAIALSLMCEQTSGTVMPGAPMHETKSLPLVSLRKENLSTFRSKLRGK